MPGFRSGRSRTPIEWVSPGILFCGGAGTRFLALVRGLSRRPLREAFERSDRRDFFDRSRDFLRLEVDSLSRLSLRERPREASLDLRELCFLERARLGDLRLREGSLVFRLDPLLLDSLRSDLLERLEGLLDGERDGRRFCFLRLGSLSGLALLGLVLAFLASSRAAASRLSLSIRAVTSFLFASSSAIF